MPPLSQSMTAYEGYQWFLPTWFTPRWWDTDFFNGEGQANMIFTSPVPCTTRQMRRAIDGHMSLTNAFFGPEESHIVGNLTVAQWKDAYLERLNTTVGGSLGSGTWQSPSLRWVKTFSPFSVFHILSNFALFYFISINFFSRFCWIYVAGNRRLIKCANILLIH